jgi:hypothetical protein
LLRAMLFNATFISLRHFMDHLAPS